MIVRIMQQSEIGRGYNNNSHNNYNNNYNYDNDYNYTYASYKII